MTSAGTSHHDPSRDTPASAARPHLWLRAPANWAVILLSFLLATALTGTLPAAGLAPPSQDYVLRFGGSIAIAPLALSLDLGTEFTLEAWVYLEAASPYGIIIGKTHHPRDEDPYQSYVLSFTDTGLRVEFVQTTGQQGSYRTATASTDLPFSTWTHVAGTLGGATMRLFINGEEVTDNQSPGPPENGAVPFAIGSGAAPDNGITCCGIKGALRQARVWNRALSGSELTENAGMYLTVTEPGLVANWPLDDGAGQAARDLGPNGTNLSLGTSPDTAHFDPRWVHTTTIDNGPFLGVEEFQMPVPFSSSEGKLIDFDSDGDLDVLMAHFNWPDTPGPLQAFGNDGQGQFSDLTRQVLGSQDIQMVIPRDMKVADFNGDGRMDIFIADTGEDVDPYPGGQSRILIQTADGRLIDETSTRIPLQKAYTHSVCAGDIDGDGDIDIYVGNIWGQQQIGPRFYINDGAGYFTPDTTRLPPSLTSLQQIYDSCAFVDVDGDGDLDLVLGAQSNQNLARDAILLNDGRGNFSFAPETAMPPRYGGPDRGTVNVATADFDRDGWPDLLMGTHRGYQEPYLQLLLNNGDGTFRDATDSIPPQIWPLSSITGEVWIKWITPADLNGDGWVDFVTSTLNADPRLYLNMGRAQFQDASEILPVLPNFVSLLLAGDLDGDGDVDLFVTTGSGNYLVARNLKPFGPVPSPKALTVTKSGSGRGWVTSSPAGIRCGADCSETYTAGTIVTLAARAGPRSVFAGWSGACSGTDACTVTMDADKAVSASFSRR